jgi:hypothetical protein
MLATGARQKLGLPAQAIDWEKLYTTVNAAYLEGQSEEDINWQRLVKTCLKEGTAKTSRFSWRFAKPLGWAAAAAALIWIAILQTQVSNLRTQLTPSSQPSDTHQKQPFIIPDSQPRPTRSEKKNENAATHAVKNNIVQKGVASSSPRTAFGTFVEFPPISSPKKKLTVSFLNDSGVKWVLDGQGNLKWTGVVSLSPSVQQGVKDILRRQAVIIQQPANIMSHALRITFKLLSPVSNVTTDRPTFRWERLPEATKYKVKVVRNSDFKKAAESEWLSVVSDSRETTVEWALPESESLPDGVYYWLVTAELEDGKQVTSPDQSQRQAMFFVHAKQTYAKSDLLLGIFYAQVGLLDDAEREFNMLLSANPKSIVAQKLLESVKALRQPQPDKISPSVQSQFTVAQSSPSSNFPYPTHYH